VSNCSKVNRRENRMTTSNVKTKGVFDENGVKNFMITNKDTGECHVALRTGSKFSLGGFTGTLAECKEIVSAGRVCCDADDEPTVDFSGRDLLTPAASPQVLLAKVVAASNVLDVVTGVDRRLIVDCLDCFGLWDHELDCPEDVTAEMDLSRRDIISDKKLR